MDSVKANEDICTIKEDENENKSQETPNLSVEKISTEALQAFPETKTCHNEVIQSKLFTECTISTAPSDTDNQMIPSENISKEDSLMANVVLKTSTACPNEGSQQSEILASTKDTIPQEAPNALDVKEKGKDPDSNLEEGSKTPFKDVSEIDPIKNGLQINDGMAENVNSNSMFIYISQ